MTGESKDNVSNVKFEQSPAVIDCSGLMIRRLSLHVIGGMTRRELEHFQRFGGRESLR